MRNYHIKLGVLVSLTVIYGEASTAESLSPKDPVFVGCRDHNECSFTMGLVGSFTCVVYDVQQYIRLNVTIDNPGVEIFYQKESAITEDGVTNVTVTSEYNAEPSSCGKSAIAVCQVVTGTMDSANTTSSLLEINIENCEGPLTPEEKVWLGAITIFPFLWLFTLIFVVNMNRDNISDFLCRKRNFKMKDSLRIRPRLLKELDEKHDHELYIYFVDQKCCIAISEKEPKRSLQLLLEKHIPLSKKSKRNNNHLTPSNDIQLHSPRKQHDERSLDDRDSQQTQSLVSQASLSPVDGEADADEIATVPDSDVGNDFSSRHPTEKTNDCVIEITQNNTHVIMPEWCRCGSCQEASTNREKICCRRTVGECVTEDALFVQLVLDQTTLEAAMAHVHDLKGLQVGPDNGEFRKAAFKEYVCWQIGPTQKFSRVIIPSCVVRQIRNQYPRTDGTYKGFVLPTRFERTCY